MVALVTSRLWFVTLATVVLAVGCRAKSRSHATGGAMTVNAAVRNLFDAWNAGDVAKLAAQNDAAIVQSHRMASCPKRNATSDQHEVEKTYSEIARAVARERGRTFTIVNIVNDTTTIYPAGEPLSDGCIPEVEIVSYRVKLDLSVAHQGTTYAQSATVKVFQADGMAFIMGMPALSGCSGAIDRVNAIEARDKQQRNLKLDACQTDGWSTRKIDCLANARSIVDVDDCLHTTLTLTWKLPPACLAYVDAIAKLERCKPSARRDALLAIYDANAAMWKQGARADDLAVLDLPEHCDAARSNIDALFAAGCN